MKVVGSSEENVMVKVDVVDGGVELFASDLSYDVILLSPSEAREVAGALMLAAFDAERR